MVCGGGRETPRDAKRDNHQGISAAFDSWETQTSILTGRNKWEAGNKEGNSSIHMIDDTQCYTVCAYLTVSLAAMGVTASFPTGFRLHRVPATKIPPGIQWHK